MPWRAIRLCCLIVWLVGASNAPFAHAESPGPSARLLESVNDLRLEAGFIPLKMNAHIKMAALAQARHLARAGRLSHFGPNGESLGDRLRTAGYDFAEAAENLAAGPARAADVGALWRTSPEHNRNMLTPGYSEAGTGHAASRGMNYWVLILARPGAR